MAPIPRLAPGYQGPALFSYGFRPFFLLGSAYALLAVVIWLPVYLGGVDIPTAFNPRDWHIHEMLFGYLAAIVAGFLLTAIPNWTGRLPLQGGPLIGLLGVWITGRIVIACSFFTGAGVAGLLDSAFLLVMFTVVAREIVAGRNWRNLIVLVPVGILASSNIAFHVEATLRGSAEFSTKVSIAAILILIMVVGGRVVPSFTRNWLARREPGPLPAPFGKFDAVALIASLCALVLWIIIPVGLPSGIALLAGGTLQAIRLGRWAGYRTTADRLVLVLHVGFVFVPLGFLLSGLAALGIAPASAGLHSWMAGAAGTMTLAIMTRASLGHTGRPLLATRTTELIYAAVVFAAICRVAAALMPQFNGILLHAAALGWIAAFAGFVTTFGPVLTKPRLGSH